MTAATAVLVVSRIEVFSIAATVTNHLSFLHRSEGVQRHALLLVSVPLASLVVVVFRIPLGIRMLGPFRPILIAAALHATGVLLGSLFTVAVLAVVLALRPGLRGGWLPYFGRLSVMLAAVVLLEVASLLVGVSAGIHVLERASYFPIVVLCLTADGFARVAASEGHRPALWRASTTLFVAILINLLLLVPGLQRLLLHYPELMLAETGGVIFVASRCKWGLLSRLNPVTTPKSPIDWGPVTAVEGRPPAPRGN